MGRKWKWNFESNVFYKEVQLMGRRFEKNSSSFCFQVKKDKISRVSFRFLKFYFNRRRIKFLPSTQQFKYDLGRTMERKRDKNIKRKTGGKKGWNYWCLTNGWRWLFYNFNGVLGKVAACDEHHWFNCIKGERERDTRYIYILFLTPSLNHTVCFETRISSLLFFFLT